MSAFLLDGLDAEDYDRNYADRTLVRRILAYFRPQRRFMIFVAGAITFQALLQAAVPVLISTGLDWVLIDRSTAVVVGLVVAVAMTGVLGWVCNFIQRWLSARVVGDVVLQLRQDAFAAVLERDMSFYDENPTGKVVSRITSDTEDFATVITLTLNTLSQVLMIGVITVMLFLRNPFLALLVMLIVPIVVIIALAFRRIARKTTRRQQRSTARVNANLQETMSGISVAKNFRQEATVYSEFSGINAQNYAVTLRQGLVFAAIFPVLFGISGLATVVLVLVGGQQVLAGQVAYGEWYLFLQSVGLFWFPLTSVASFWSQFQQGLSASERVFALIDAEPAVQQRESQTVPRLRGEVDFRDVDFAYEPNRPVLQKFNLHVKAGEMIALVGHTGAGKSTIGRLLLRFYEFQGGMITVDGVDLRTVDLAQYRRQLGLVPQTPFLFTGTVAENIAYAHPEADLEQIRSAAQQVGGGDWLAALPQGLETEVGEGGSALSMGQRQLVALARLLLQDPALVILDEATASVDPLTEAQIAEGLQSALADRTSIVIAHRLSTIEHADRIIVMRSGEIVESGTHQSLLAARGAYCDVYNSYFRHQSPDYQPGQGFITGGSNT